MATSLLVLAKSIIIGDSNLLSILKAEFLTTWTEKMRHARIRKKLQTYRSMYVIYFLLLYVIHLDIPERF